MEKQNMQIHQVKKLKSKKRSNRSHCNSKKRCRRRKKEYKVYVIKDTEDISNNNIQEIIAGQGAVTEGTITPEADGTYTTYIKKDATTIELTAKAQYPYSKVSIEGNREKRGTNTTTINMGNTAEKQIIVKITSIDGDVQQYLVNIYREPSELYLKQVYVDNRLTTRTDDQNFTIDIVKRHKTVDIKAILYDQKRICINCRKHRNTISKHITTI